MHLIMIASFVVCRVYGDDDVFTSDLSKPCSSYLHSMVRGLHFNQLSKQLFDIGDFFHFVSLSLTFALYRFYSSRLECVCSFHSFLIQKLK